MKFTLDDIEITLLLNFANISKVEKAIGSVFSFAQKLSEKSAAFTDVVNVYYFMQEGSAYSQEAIARKIHADGLVLHLGNMAVLLGEIFSGNKETTKKKAAETTPEA